ncbi:UDP-N-acetylmuramoyl-L-alanine--D-glutamate ligase [Sulfobacillus thermosulfidooxidans]|uniref:UDP-N-acetylmuramoyl-L-alanine--D-glutamate ligase n=1 Tax=Sulfobacillus thermosulfidooxidans TaxID=28034 RepID=UPI0006B5441C|nr:UDP-N-acetylmuramoyl-L-alanine--D-glutamate ligase [Sulfobacillus thermosulfidooxidans]
MSQQKTVAIVGLGVNNRPLVPFLLAQGAEVIVADKRPEEVIRESLREMGLGDIPVLGGEHYLSALSRVPHLDTVYLTPGMVKNLPPIEQMRKQGTKISCETDVFFQYCPAPIMGITGSAGKTTTTTLVGEALREDGTRLVFVGGNIGHSLWDDFRHIRPDSWVVMELSSFQLELVEHSPHGAAILNLSPNHLDIHGSMSSYAQAKSHIFQFQSPDDWLLLPYPPTFLNMMEAVPEGRVLYFSLEDHGQAGTFITQDWIMFRDFSHALTPCFPVNSIQLPGTHNVLNVLAAVAIVKMAGGDMHAMRRAIERFHGVPHRLEKVRKHDNILYINDSIATAPDRTMAALRAITDPIVLIAGGYDKHLDYDALGQAIAHSSVHHVIVLGQVREKLAQAIARYSTIPVMRVDTFEQAVDTARQVAKAGDTVLLSPAAASYDMFQNFEERGQRFREIVNRL